MIKSAVLLLISPENEILFIKRNRFLKKHPGEISFPGGKFDFKKDKTIKDTAIRETYEEIGLEKHNYQITGELPPEKTVSTYFIVYTFVAKIIRLPELKINKREVEKIIFVPVEHLIDEKYKVKVPLKINSKKYLNTFYYYKNNLIWGATSRILDNFLKIYKND